MIGIHSPAMNGRGVFNVLITNTPQTLQQLITAAGGSLDLSAESASQIKHFDLLPEDGDVLWTDDGTTPTGGGVGTHTGFVAFSQQVFPVRNDAARMRVMKFVRDDLSSVHACLWVAE